MAGVVLLLFVLAAAHEDDGADETEEEWELQDVRSGASKWSGSLAVGGVVVGSGEVVEAEEDCEGIIMM